MKRLEEFGKFVEISGFRGVHIVDARTFVEVACQGLPQGVEAQFLDAGLAASWRHLYFAALNALTAIQTKRAFSKSLAVETALYASAQRQIKKAFDVIGIKPETEHVAVLIIGNSEGSVKAGLVSIAKVLGKDPDDSVLDLTADKKGQICAAFDVSETELKTVSSRGNADQALVDAVVERVALLSTRL